jgi:diaminopimelate epimerase
MSGKSKTSFVKMTGAGNDFILFDELQQEGAKDWPRLAPVLCDRRYGIGADGLLILAPSPDSDFRMDYYNADGSFGGMCGNGGRCAAAFYMEKLSRNETRFTALGDSYTAHRSGPDIVLRMKDPHDLRLNMRLEVDGISLPFHYIDTGAPHAVFFESELPERVKQIVSSDGIVNLGRRIREDPYFKPGGTNVDFVRLRDSDSVSMRTYERGVEDETLACGTGATACSVISALVQGLRPPIEVLTRSNEKLKVRFNQGGGRVRDVDLEGPAVAVYRGEWIFP